MADELLSQMRDVTPLPGFPGIPSPVQWALLITAILLLATLSATVALRPWRRRAPIAILREGLRQAELLRRELPHTEVRSGASRLGIQLRRLLTALGSESFRGATGKNLESLVAAQSGTAREIGMLLIELDTRSFLPGWSSSDSLALLTKLLRVLEEGHEGERRRAR